MELHGLMRSQTFPNVGTSDTLLLGPNARRKGLIIGAPIGANTTDTADNQVIHAVSCAAIGVKLSYVAPDETVGVVRIVTYDFLGGVSPTLALQAIIGGVTITLDSRAASNLFVINLPLADGDTLQINCTAAGAGSTVDMGIFVDEVPQTSRVTINFGSVAVLDNGLNLYPGNAPLQLVDEHMGAAIKEEIHAISNITDQQLCVIELFTA